MQLPTHLLGVACLRSPFLGNLHPFEEKKSCLCGELVDISTPLSELLFGVFPQAMADPLGLSHCSQENNRCLVPTLHYGVHGAYLEASGPVICTVEGSTDCMHPVSTSGSLP